MKRILVTGGAGYIGSHTVYKLVEDGNFDVYVFDNLVKGHKEALEIISKKFNKEIKFYQGDLQNYDEILECISETKPDAIIHFAAYSEVGESVKDPAKYYKNNISGGLNLLEAMRTNNVDFIVFSSTAAVFGEPKEIPISESTEKLPINPYGKSKLMFEKILHDYDSAYGIKYVVLRYFNACGAQEDGLIGEDHNPESHLIPIIMEAAKGTREAVTIFGDDYQTKDGTAVRDYIHVFDLADAHIKAVEFLIKERKSEDFNLGSSTGYTVKEVIDAVKEISQKDFQVNIGERRAGDPTSLIASNQKAKDMLNWQNTFSLQDIVQSAWKWENRKGNYA